MRLMLIARLAWRNILRNPRRTALTLLTVMVGCAMILFMDALGKGGHDQMIEDAVSLDTGHVAIHEKGFQDARTIDYAFIPSENLLAAIKADPRITASCPRIYAGGLLAAGENTSGVIIQGVDPEKEVTVTTLYKAVLPGGRYLMPGDRATAVLGEKLAGKMGIAVGDTVAVISQGFDGSIAAERLTVVGLARTGNPEYDRQLLQMPVDTASETFSMMGYIHALSLRLSDISFTEGVKKSLSAAAAADGGEALEVLGWKELMPELVQFIVMDDASAYIFKAILFAVVAFGVLNTIQMSVFERTREFGIMLAIGTRPGIIRAVVTLESVMVTVMGVLLGGSLGWGLGAWFAAHPLDYSKWQEEISLWGVTTTVYPAKNSLESLFITAGVILVLGFLFSLPPARRAGNLDPVRSVRRL